MPPDEPIIVLPEVQETEDLADDVDEVAESLAVHSIISEERHDEIIEGVNECRTRLESLSNQIPAMNAESPMLAKILEELATVKSDLQSLKSSLDTKLTSPRPNESPEPVVVEVIETPAEAPVLPSPDELTVEPSVEEPTPEPARRKYRRI